MADDQVDPDTLRKLLASQPPEPANPTSPTDPSASAPRQLSPQSTGDIPPPPSFEMPPAPRLYDAPPPQPSQQQESPFEVFKNPMVVLAGLSSLFTRQPLMGAMNFATGAMNGYRTGNKEIFEQNKVKFDEAMKATIEHNKAEMDAYNVAWDRKKQLNWQQQIPALWAEAVKNKDEVMMAAIRSGDPAMIEKILLNRDTAANGLVRATEITKIKQDLMNQQRFGGDTPADVASNIVDGMERGDEPPTVQGLGQVLGGSVRNEAAKRHFNLATAQLSWLRAQQQVKAMNSTNMLKYKGLAESVNSTIGEVLDLSEQLKLGRYPVKNRAELMWLVQTKAGTPEGDLAVRYLGAVKTLKEEFANLAQGGGVPTEPAWALANAQINEDFGVDALKNSLSEVRRLIGYRVRAINDVGSQPYSPTGTPAAPVATSVPTAPAAGDGWKVEPVQ